MSKIVTFGELMLRLQPEGYLRITQAEKFESSFAGAEANVAVSLSNFGEDVSFVSKIPDNLIGQSAVNSLRKYGVNTSDVIRGGDRLGLFYIEKGASQRNSVVIYDRKNSAIHLAQKHEFNWDKIFDGAEWFHFTGITPALGDETAEICMEACKIAKKKGLMISCDLNYRNKLWSKKKACEVMTELCKYVDVCIANEEDISDVFNISSINNDVESGKLNKESYKESAKKLCDKFNMKMVAITLRTSITANDNDWAGLLYDGKDFYQSKEYKIHIVDRVGGGDSFGAGLIYSLIHNYDKQSAIEFAVAASCLKQTIQGDFNQVSVEEVKRLACGNGTGRIRR